MTVPSSRATCACNVRQESGSPRYSQRSVHGRSDTHVNSVPRATMRSEDAVGDMLGTREHPQAREQPSYACNSSSPMAQHRIDGDAATQSQSCAGLPSSYQVALLPQVGGSDGAALGPPSWTTRGLTTEEDETSANASVAPALAAAAVMASSISLSNDVITS